MNSQYPNGQRPASYKNGAGTATQKRKTPAWKVLTTILIMVLSMAIVLGLLVNYLILPKLGGGIGGLISNMGEHLEPTVDNDSTYVDESGMPVLSGDRKEKVFNFLIVGLNNDTGNNTDTIMLAQYDVGNQAINVVQIPRDTYINGTYNFHKINSVFAAGYNSASAGSTVEERRVVGIAGDKENNIEGLCGFIESNMAVKIDFYVLVDLDAFESFIDSIGGLRINVPCNMDYEDPEQDLYIHLKAGEQVLSGYDAMCLVRNRKTFTDADYGRMNVQKIFLSALLKQVKEDMTDTKTLTGIIDIVFNDVTTNLSLSNCVYFATQALSVDMSKLRMVTLPTLSVGNAISVLESDAVDIINSFVNVYTEPVDAETFDPKCRLTNKKDSGLYKTYLYNRTEYEIFTADSVDENSIELNTFH